MTSPSTFLLVLHVGFAGSRRLLDTEALRTINEDRFLADLDAWLVARIARLPAELHLSASHSLRGISQIAAGADMLFTRACRELGIPQSIFLPQPRDAYLANVASNGVPDFTNSEKKAALELLASPHVIEVRVVSDAADLHSRLEDVNREIVRASDVVICMIRAGADSKRGGTVDVLERAAALSKPTLELTVAVDAGRPRLSERWHRKPSA